MKRISLLFITGCCLIALSCKKDSSTVAVNGVTVLKDAAAWQTATVGTGFKPLETKDTLFIVAHNNEENIIIGIKQKGVGTYQPTSFNAWYFSTVGLDAVVSEYQLSADASNSVIITDYNQTTHTLKGLFTLTLKNTYKNGAFPDIIKFTNGKIDTQLSDVYMDPMR